MAKTESKEVRVHGLLVEAQAIVKLAQLFQVPDDPEDAVKNCALMAASRLIDDAMAVNGA